MGHCQEEKYQTFMFHPEDVDRDRNILLDIFPEEVWLLILRRTNIKDLNKIYKSSPFLQALLLPYCHEFMFDAVIPFILNYLPKEENSGKLLANSRMVCRFWREAVDTFLQDVSTQQDFRTPIQESVHMKNDLVNTYFSGDQGRDARVKALLQIPAYQSYFRIWIQPARNATHSFYSHFKSSHSAQKLNPFVSRRLGIYYHEYNVGYPHFVIDLLLILSKFGHHIWFLDLLIPEVDLNTSHFKLRSMLELMPNLKAINVWMDKVELEDWNPLNLPQFSSLQILRVDGKDSDCILTNIATKNPQIQRMDCCVPRGIANGHVLFANRMPNLQEVKISCKTFEDFQKFCRVKVASWPLKKLVVNLVEIWEIIKWEKIDQCFQILEQKCGNMLQELHIVFPEVSDLYKVASRLHLPNLTVLTLELSVEMRLDFILPMKNNLKVLNVRLQIDSYRLPRIVTENAIIFFGQRNNLLLSNIWEVFPKLGKVTFGERFENTYKIYNRQQWLDLQVFNDKKGF